MKRITIWIDLWLVIAIGCISLTGCHSSNKIIESETFERDQQNINEEHTYEHENDNYGFFDYVLNIDGIQYEFPAKIERFTYNGWEIAKNGELDPGDTENIKLKKENVEIDVVIKNYDSHISKYVDSYVCGLEVNESCTKSGLDFQIPMNISISSSEEEIEKWIGEYYIFDSYVNTETVDYTIVDDLYFKENYGYTFRVENHVITSIKINYQPDISDRKEKGEILTKWSVDPVVDVESVVMKHMNFDIIYQVDIDGDRQKDQVYILSLIYNYSRKSSLTNSWCNKRGYLWYNTFCFQNFHDCFYALPCIPEPFSHFVFQVCHSVIQVVYPVVHVTKPIVNINEF